MKLSCGRIILLALLVFFLVSGGLLAGDWIRWPGSGQNPLVALFCAIPIVLISTFWVVQDAPKHNSSPLIWGLITFFVVWPVGLLLYLIFGRNN